SFLASEQWQPEKLEVMSTEATQEEATKLSWYQPIVKPLTLSMRELLLPRLENYKLNATHLSNFLDLSRGGPEGFIVNNLLRFPQAPAPLASYGSAIHAALQRAHAHTAATGELK